MAKLSAVCVTLLLLTPTQPRAGGAQLLAEFPPQDYVVWMAEREGRLSKLAERRLEDAPATPETVRLLGEAKNFSGVIRALRLIVATEPRRMADGFAALGDAAVHLREGDEETRRNVEALRAIIADGRKRLPELPREEAARAERAFLRVEFDVSPDRDRWSRGLHQLIQEYRGSEAALDAEVDLIGNRRPAEQIEKLEAFIRAHPGTVAAAKALYLKGFQYHSGNLLGSIFPRSSDPLERFMRVIDIASELESGRYPKCEWVDKAPSLVIGFFSPPDAKMAPGTVDKMLDAYQDFARRHFVVHDTHPTHNGVGYVITHKMAQLFARKGQQTAGVERVLDELERSAPDPAAVRYLRGLFYMKSAESQPAGERQAMLANAKDTLATLSTAGSGLYHRKALATLASLEFGDGNYAAAVDSFRRYAARYPQSSWAWVAMLRTGQCERP